MKLINSLGFLFVGGVMLLLPHVAPALCPIDIFGNSIRATWLHVMGLTQGLIGGSFLLRRAGAELAGWLERWPELLNPAPVAPEFDPVPQAGAHAYQRVQVARSVGDVIPVDFKPAWSEQRAA